MSSETDGHRIDHWKLTMGMKRSCLLAFSMEILCGSICNVPTYHRKRISEIYFGVKYYNDKQDYTITET